MIYLLLTIALNAGIIIGFKLFTRWKIDNLQAIVVNYWICVITGCLFNQSWPISSSSLHQDWTIWSCILGFAFIGIFNLIAYCTREDGITITTIANKLSLVIPVAFAIMLYGDRMSWLKGAGILLAIPAVYLSSRSDEGEKREANLWVAILLFIASGLLDTVVNYVTRQFFKAGNSSINGVAQAAFLTQTFLMAALIGSCLVGYLLFSGKKVFAWKNVLGGLLLGVPNFFSMYVFVRLLQSGYLPASAAIPVNNIGIVLMASVSAILFFREKMNGFRLIGMLLSIASILIILLSDLHA